MFAEVGSGAVFLVSVLPFFWVRDAIGSVLRFDLWYASFVVFFAMLTLRRR